MPAFCSLLGIPGGPCHPLRPEVVDAWMEWARAAGRIEPGVAQRVRMVSRLIAKDHVSGEQLALALGTSRAAVHKHIDRLRVSGLEIESLKGRGYVLTTRGDELVPEVALLPLMNRELPRDAGARVFGFPYLYKSAVGSTNTWLKEHAAQGAPAGAVAATDYQVEGRGRLGRPWTSEAGKDLTFSLLLRPQIPPEGAHLVILSAAVAVAAVLEEIVFARHSAEDEDYGEIVDGRGAGRVGIKWPNDVLVDGGKVCGILAEAVADMDGLEWIVVGMGVNANGDPSATVLDRPTGFPPTSLRAVLGRKVPRALLLARIVSSFAWWWSRAEIGAYSPIVDGCRSRDVLEGRPVRVRVGDVGGDYLVEGEAAGLGGRGELLVRRWGGEIVEVSSGEATILEKA